MLSISMGLGLRLLAATLGRRAVAAACAVGGGEGICLLLLILSDAAVSSLLIAGHVDGGQISCCLIDAVGFSLVRELQWKVVVWMTEVWKVDEISSGRVLTLCYCLLQFEIVYCRYMKGDGREAHCC